MKLSRGVAAVSVAVVFLIGCGGGGDASTSAGRHREIRSLAVTLNGWEGPETVGLVMAQSRGYFADEGLEADVLAPVNPTAPIRYVLDGTDDVAVAPEPQVVMAQAKGAPIVAIGSLVERPTASLIWPPGVGIFGISDLRGRTIGIAGLPYQPGFLQNMLAEEGLSLDDVKIRRLGYKLVPELAAGRVDAILGSWDLEPFDLEARGPRPTLTRVQEHGVPHYDELVLVARRDRIAEDPQAFRSFMRAVLRGTATAVRHPDAAAETIDEGTESNPESSLAATKAQLLAVLPFLNESGHIAPRQVGRLVRWMYKRHLIKRELPLSEVFTDDYLDPEFQTSKAAGP
jgi:putative hydroxymethylpyrimidine transport system substrate-binding protein